LTVAPILLPNIFFRTRLQHSCPLFISLCISNRFRSWRPPKEEIVFLASTSKSSGSFILLFCEHDHREKRNEKPHQIQRELLCLYIFTDSTFLSSNLCDCSENKAANNIHRDQNFDFVYTRAGQLNAQEDYTSR
jgi:hypothetical protein